MQFDSLVPTFSPKYQQTEEDWNYSTPILSVTHIYMQVTKQQPYFAVLSNERDRIKILEKRAFRKRGFYNQEERSARNMKHKRQHNIWVVKWEEL